MNIITAILLSLLSLLPPPQTLMSPKYDIIAARPAVMPLLPVIPLRLFHQVGGEVRGPVGGPPPLMIQFNEPIGGFLVEVPITGAIAGGIIGGRQVWHVTTPNLLVVGTVGCYDRWEMRAYATPAMLGRPAIVRCP